MRKGDMGGKDREKRRGNEKRERETGGGVRGRCVEREIGLGRVTE